MMTAAVAYCDECDVVIRASVQINLRERAVEYIAPFPQRHAEHVLTIMKNGLLTWT
jgi:hypothetical protein